MAGTHPGCGRSELKPGLGWATVCSSSCFSTWSSPNREPREVLLQGSGRKMPLGCRRTAFPFQDHRSVYFSLLRWVVWLAVYLFLSRYLILEVRNLPQQIFYEFAVKGVLFSSILMFLNGKMLHQKSSAVFTEHLMELIYILNLPEHLWSVLKHCPLFLETARTRPGRRLSLTWAVRDVEAASPGRETYPQLLCNTVNFLFCSALCSFSFSILFANTWMLTDIAIIILQGRSQAAFGKSSSASSMNSRNLDHLSTTGV